ncbi:MAG TPA: hypothetical protein DCP38_01070, partial [Acidobacteria bacterium]|nr:hypothetical protein [Acidobacteriota bacterium]
GIAFSAASGGGDPPLELLSANALLLLFAALGMHLLVFEEMTYELRATNRRLERREANCTRRSSPTR